LKDSEASIAGFLLVNKICHLVDTYLAPLAESEKIEYLSVVLDSTKKEAREIGMHLMQKARLEEVNEIKQKELSRLIDDFQNLMENYWYAIRTRSSTPLPGDQEKSEVYAKELSKFWTEGRLHDMKSLTLDSPANQLAKEVIGRLPKAMTLGEIHSFAQDLSELLQPLWSTSRVPRTVAYSELQEALPPAYRHPDAVQEILASLKANGVIK